MTKTQKFAIALVIITLLIVLRTINKSTNSPKEPLNLPAVDATTVLPDGKSKIQGAENIFIAIKHSASFAGNEEAM